MGQRSSVSILHTLTFRLSSPLKIADFQKDDVIVVDPPATYPSSIEASFVSRKLDSSIIFGELKFSIVASNKLC